MDLFIRTVGIARARLKIGMANLVYNFRRLVYLDRIAVRLRGRSGSRQGSALPAPYAAAKKPGPRRKHPRLKPSPREMTRG